MQSSTLSNWYLPTRGTSDYFNRCADKETQVSIPCNLFGYQEPHSANGMAGFIAFDSASDYREYLAVQLSSPLLPNKCYYFEMYINLSDVAPHSLDNIGVFFGSTASYPQANIIYETPQINRKKGEYFTDPDKWEKISGYYKAKGWEEYIIIGSFNDNKSYKSREVPPFDCLGNVHPLRHYSYYFVDDVLLTDSFPPPPPRIHELKMDCTAEHLDVDQTIAGVTYKWDDGSTLPYRDVSTPGKYWVETNWNGCTTLHDTFYVTSSIVYTPLADTTICSNTFYTILPQQLPGFDYLWFNGSAAKSITVRQPGTYFVKISKGFCVFKDTIRVAVLKPFDVLLGNDTAICAGQSFSFTDLGVSQTGIIYTYQWQRNSINIEQATAPSIAVWQAGIYTLIKSAANCSASSHVLLNTIPAAVDPMIKDTFICNEGSLQLNSLNPDVYRVWNNEKTTQVITVNTPGTYWVKIWKDERCVITDSITITQRFLHPGFLGDDTTVCKGTAITLKSQQDYLLHSWSTGESTNSIVVNNPGVYTLHVFDGYCENTDTIAVFNRSLPNSLARKDSLICEMEGKQVEIPLHNTYLYFINDSIKIQSPFYLNTKGSYRIRVEDNFGCSLTETLNIIDDCDPSLFVPNVFTRDGNNLNDYFAPVASYSERIIEYRMEIYNRWGQQIFTSNAYAQTWDGTYDSQYAPADTYVYIIRAKWKGYKRDPEKEIKGTVTLLR